MAQSAPDSINARGVGVPKKDKNKLPAAGRTFAVIVGVSTYNHIKSLEYADKDALLFKEFLQSSAGGNVKDSNILIKLNEEAREDLLVRINSWVEKAGTTAGDRVYFYFAGHGDAKNGQNIFFLLPDCNPDGDINNYYRGNVVQLHNLKTDLFADLISRQVQVILIWDACRTNEQLPGSKNALLAQQSLDQKTDGEIVMMSASAGESALENKSYANGHGLFTFFLIDGLSGAGDKAPFGNEDGMVSIQELSMYVPMMVRNDATKKYQKDQNPRFTFITNQVPLSRVDESFKQFWSVQQTSGADLARNNTRSGALTKDTRDTALVRLYEKCLQSIKKGSMGEDEGAMYWLRQLEKQFPTDTLTKDAAFNIAMEYINLAQQKINLYFNSLDDLRELDSISQGDMALRAREAVTSTNFANAGYLDWAIKLLRERGFKDEAYLQLLEGKKYFLLARSFHMKEKKVATAPEAYAYIRKAIAINPDAAYNFHMLALLFQDDLKFDSAIAYESEAVRLAPNWSYVLKALGHYFERQKKFQSAIKYYKMVFERNPGYLRRYDAYYVNYALGRNFYRLNEFDSAMKYYKAAIAIEYKKIPEAFYEIGNILKKKNQWDSAIVYYRQALGIKPNHTDASINMGNCYFYLGQKDSAIACYRRAVSIDTTSVIAYVNLADALKNGMNYDEALTSYTKLIKLRPTEPKYYYQAAGVYLLKGDMENGIGFLDKAFSKGYNNVDVIKADKALEGIRKDERFLVLARKYFPTKGF